QWGQHPNIPP
uniref:Bradykinin-potentiating peptide S5,1 n=1 Tax=Bothrops insularis TaxID=8723 RepID=BPP8_BOTIN|nr:RecName: Full=Bradykinin-potentiating peptide S5,1; Short=BPP; AltName: Full=Angiotensin-converting enzyme inhibitor [Bothrops insularis]